MGRGLKYKEGNFLVRGGQWEKASRREAESGSGEVKEPALTACCLAKWGFKDLSLKRITEYP